MNIDLQFIGLDLSIVVGGDVEPFLNGYQRKHIFVSFFLEIDYLAMSIT